MLWKEFLVKVKDDFETELQECIVNGFNPYCHAANWNYLKDRITKYFANPPEPLENEYDGQIQTDIDNIIANIKLIVEKWLQYYKQNNEDGCYDSWLDRFWIEEKPDKETEEKYYMTRMYEKFVKEGTIEIYHYRESAGEISQAFLNKWYQRYNCPYTEGEDEYLYIGQKGTPGNFYFGYGDFYEPVDSPRKSAWWKLVSQIVKSEKNQCHMG